MPDVLFAGETFRTAGEVPAMALLRLAKAAKDDADTDSVDGFAALYELLEQIVDASDWARFQDVAVRTRAKGDDLVDFLREYVTKRQAAAEKPQPEPVTAAPEGMWL